MLAVIEIRITVIRILFILRKLCVMYYLLCGAKLYYLGKIRFNTINEAKKSVRMPKVVSLCYNTSVRMLMEVSLCYNTSVRMLMEVSLCYNTSVRMLMEASLCYNTSVRMLMEVSLCYNTSVRMQGEASLCNFPRCTPKFLYLHP